MAPTKRRSTVKAAPPTAFIPHVGWLRHQPGEELIVLLRQGYFEAAEQAFCRLFLRPGDTFIDCGAHIGLYAIIAGQATDDRTRIIAIEPSRETADHLEFNLRKNGVANAEVIRAAVWREPGTLRFVAAGEGRAAFSHVAFDAAEQGATVRAITLDQVVADQDPGPIALVKVDVEGAEPEVLKGAQRSIEEGRLPLWMVEFTEHNLRRRGLSTEELRRQFTDAGYKLYELSEESFELVPFTAEGPIWFRNLFATNKVERVNARLRSATNTKRAIARDILGRAHACTRFKELEELDLYRGLANEAELIREWALEAEKRAERAQQEAGSNRKWAESSDEKLAAEVEKSAQLGEWAKKAESLLSEARKLAEDNRAWAQRSDELLAAETEKSAQFGKWAEEADARAAEARTLAEDSRAWAQRSDGLLAAETEKSAQLGKWAKEAEARAAEARKLAEENLARAQRAEALLAAEKDALAQARAEVEDLRSRFVRSQEAAEAHRMQAERTGQKLADDQLRLVQVAARADQAEERLQRAQALLEETGALLEQRGKQIEALDRELASLRPFAARFAWLYGLWKRTNDARN